MKISRIPEIDLAKAMTIEPGPALEAHLRGFNRGAGRYSYEPTRNSTAELVGARSPLFGAMARAPWSKLESAIRTACKRGPDEIAANLPVSKLLFDAAIQREWQAVQEPMGRFLIGLGGNVRYWSDVVLADADGPFIPFFDHRRRGGLEKPAARRIAFSMQNIAVRDRYPDLSTFRLAVIRFPVCGEERSLEIHFHDETTLLPYEDLATRVQTVYETWARVSDDRSEKKRASGGSSTPFGF